MKRSQLKIKAQKLRQKGNSYREIGVNLGISKSTAYFWTNNEPILDAGKNRLVKLMAASKLKARCTILRKKENYLESLDQGCQVLKTSKLLGEYGINELKIFLALLYWGEGSKTQTRVVFTNSDPGMVKIYLSLLRAAFDIKNDKFSAFLHLHSYHDAEEMLIFWSKITGIDKKRISIYNKKTSGLSRKKGYKGCISVRYGDYRIFEEITLIIRRFSELK